MRDIWQPVCLCRLSKSFGYLNKDGFCSGTNCHVFTVVLGEFNVKFDSTVSSDLTACMARF